jgi:transposase InsO family protein
LSPEDYREPTAGAQRLKQVLPVHLTRHQLLASMSRRGNCYDNAHMESFWGTLKSELLATRTFATRQEARLAIFEYIEVFYNRLRLHSALGFLSPLDYEQLFPST